ncbi:MAG: DMT family transporter [Candidatus Eisenbacteria sp.]|nr:DMT family transporter [Candidatus Eisenbacteria bacterium]
MDQQSKAYLHALAAVFFWSTVASAFKLSLRVLSPIQLLLYAAFVSALMLLLILALQGRLAVLRTYSRRDYLNSLILGFLNPFLYYVVLFKAYDLLPGQEAQPLNYTWAIALAVLSVPLLKQRIRLVSLLAILISFIGVYVISTRGEVFSLHFTDPLGVSLALGSSVIWALFWIFNIRDRRDEVAKLFLSFAFGFGFTLILALLSGELIGPDGEWITPGWSGAAGAAYVGLFEMGLTFVLWLRALKLSRTTALVSNLIFLSPFVSLVLLHFVVGEHIYSSSVIGLVFIIGGIALQRCTERVRSG